MSTAKGDSAGVRAHAAADHRSRCALVFAAVFALLAFVARSVPYQLRNEMPCANVGVLKNARA